MAQQLSKSRIFKIMTAQGLWFKAWPHYLQVSDRKWGSCDLVED